MSHSALQDRNRDVTRLTRKNVPCAGRAPIHAAAGRAWRWHEAQPGINQNIKMLNNSRAKDFCTQ